MLLLDSVLLEILAYSNVPCTAIQSFRLSLGGNLTTCRKLIPDCKLAWACLCNE